LEEFPKGDFLFFICRHEGSLSGLVLAVW